MKDTTTKKGLLAIATSLLPTGATLLVKGQMYEGAILVALAAGLFIAYDVLDDRVKGKPQLPDGVSEETLRSLADITGEQLKKAIENSEQWDKSK